MMQFSLIPAVNHTNKQTNSFAIKKMKVKDVSIETREKKKICMPIILALVWAVVI